MKKVGTPALVPLRGIGRRISEDRFEKIFIRVLWIGLPTPWERGTVTRIP